MYKVTGGYLPDNCAYPGLEERYVNYNSAMECVKSYFGILDWVKIEKIDVAFHTKMCEGENYRQSNTRIFKPSEGPYNEFKVNGVGEGSLRGH